MNPTSSWSNCSVPICKCKSECYAFQCRSRQSLSKWRKWVSRLDEAYPKYRGTWKKTLRICKCHFHPEHLTTHGCNAHVPIRVKGNILPFFNDEQMDDCIESEPAVISQPIRPQEPGKVFQDRDRSPMRRIIDHTRIVEPTHESPHTRLAINSLRVSERNGRSSRQETSQAFGERRRPRKSSPRRLMPRTEEVDHKEDNPSNQSVCVAEVYEIHEDDVYEKITASP